jgi:hypothetical protein
MKKLLLLPFLTFLTFACSTDNDELENYNAAPQRVMASVLTPSQTSFGCFNNLGAHPYINTSQGLNNATITFISETPADANSGCYKVRVEIEELADCEDLSNGTGAVKTFTTNTIFYNVGSNPPQISGINRNETFACYRWRMVFEGVARSSASGCASATPWYDAPLF